MDMGGEPLDLKSKTFQRLNNRRRRNCNHKSIVAQPVLLRIVGELLPVFYRARSEQFTLVWKQLLVG